MATNPLTHLDDIHYGSQRISFEQEFEQARVLYQHANDLAESVRHAVACDSNIDLEKVENVIGLLAKSLQRCPDALFWLTANCKHPNYCVSHSVNVCLLMMLFGLHHGFSDEDVLDLGMAGFLQDVGKAMLPLALINKTDPLTQEETQQMHAHVGESLALLESMPIAPSVLAIIREHHERYDGSGYPKALRHGEISIPGSIAGICDSYDAMVSDRPYRSANTSYEALRELGHQAGSQFSEEIVAEFKRCIGIYHSGQCVKLNSGEIGVVLEQNPEMKTRPRILLLIDSEGEHYPQPFICDLLQQPHNDNGTLYTIDDVVMAADYNIDLDALHNQGHSRH